MSKVECDLSVNCTVLMTLFLHDLSKSFRMQVVYSLSVVVVAVLYICFSPHLRNKKQCIFN